MWKSTNIYGSIFIKLATISPLGCCATKKEVEANSQC